MGPGYFQRTSKHPRLCCYVFGVPPLSYDELPPMLEQAKSIKAFQVEFFISQKVLKVQALRPNSSAKSRVSALRSVSKTYPERFGKDFKNFDPHC